MNKLIFTLAIFALTLAPNLRAQTRTVGLDTTGKVVPIGGLLNYANSNNLFLINGDSQSTSNAFGVGPGEDWGVRLRTNAPWLQMKYTNFGSSGKEVLTVLSEYSTKEGTVVPVAGKSYGSGVAILDIGANDIRSAVSGATLYARCSNWCWLVRRDNMVACLTTIPQSDDYDSGENAQRLIYNNAVRTYAGRDLDVMLDKETWLTNASADQLPAAYDAGDGLHINPLGNLIVASNMALKLAYYSAPPLGRMGGTAYGYTRFTPAKSAATVGVGIPAVGIYDDNTGYSLELGPNFIQSPDNIWMYSSGGGALKFGWTPLNGPVLNAKLQVLGDAVFTAGVYLKDSGTLLMQDASSGLVSIATNVGVLSLTATNGITVAGPTNGQHRVNDTNGTARVVLDADDLGKVTAMKLNTPTNLAAFTFISTNLVSGQPYTNFAQRASVTLSIHMTNILAGDISAVSIILDQNADGTWDMTNALVMCGGVALSTSRAQLFSYLQPGARFAITNQSSGTSPSVSIISGSCLWNRE